MKVCFTFSLEHYVTSSDMHKCHYIIVKSRQWHKLLSWPRNSPLLWNTNTSNIWDSPSLGCTLSQNIPVPTLLLRLMLSAHLQQVREVVFYSNKSTNQMHQSLRSIACCSNTAQHVSGILMPIIKSSTTAVAASGFPSDHGGSSAVGRGRSGPDRPRPMTLLPSHSDGKPEVATAVYKLLTVGMRMPETCWAAFEWRAIGLRDWCIWLVDLFECMMMHGLTNPKFDL